MTPSAMELLAALALGMAVSLGAADASAQTTNYAYTGGVQIYTLPAGAIGVQIQASGAGGGGGGADSGGAGATGGSGATVVGTYSAPAGTVLNIYVGGGGSGGFTSNFGHVCATSPGAGGTSPGGFGGGAGGAAGCSGWSGGGAGGGAASAVASATSGTLLVAGGGGGGQGGSLNSSSVPSQNSTQAGTLPAGAGGVGANLGALDGGGGGGGGGGCPGGVGGAYHKDSTGTAYGAPAGAGYSCANTGLIRNFAILGAIGGAGGAGDPTSNGSTDPGGKAGAAGSIAITPIFGADASTTVSFPAAVNAGQPVTGTVLFTNGGPNTAAGDSFALTLAPNLASSPMLSGLPLGATYSYAAATGAVSFGGMPTTLASGASLGPISVTYPQPASATSTVTAVFNTTTSDPNLANNTASASVGGNPVADVASALAFPASIDAGKPVSGTLTFTNNGPSTASGLTYTLTLPANLATAPTIAALPTGATATYVAATGVVTLAGMPTTLAASLSIGPITVSYTQPGVATSTVSASINTTTTDPTPANNSATVTVAGAAVSDVAAALAFPATINAGQPVSGTLTFTNNGPSTASGLTYTLTLPANLATAPTIAALPTGATASYSAATGIVTLAGMPTTLAAIASIGPITVSYPQPGAATSTVSASISTTTTDSNPANNSATLTIAGNLIADVATTLAFPASIDAGKPVAGTLTFTNNGPSIASALTYTLTLPANLATAPTLTALPTGASVSYAAATGAVTLTGMPTTLAAAATVGPITVSYTQPGAATSAVSASISTTTTDSNPANNNAAITVAGNPIADVATALAFPASIDAGKTVTGTITFSNTGPSTASGLTFSLTLAPNISPVPTLSGLPTGATATYVAATGAVTFTGMPTTLAAATTIGPITLSYPQPGAATSTVTAAINTTTTDPNPANNSATVTIAGNPIADVASALAFPASVDAGKSVSGTLTFTNNGPSTASGLTYTLTLPANLATAPTIAALPAGATASYVAATGVVTLTGMPTTLAAAATVGPIAVSYTQPGAATSTMTAAINTTTTDPTPANNSETLTIAGNPIADVATALAFPASIDAGKAVTGTITFTNTGPSTASGLTYTLTLPPNLATAPTVTALPMGASYSYAAATGVVSFMGMPSTLAIGTTIGPITVSYSQAPTGTSIVSAGISTTTTDSNPANNSASATIAGNPIADVETTLVFPGSVNAGQIVTGTVMFTNMGPSTAAALSFNLTLPANLAVPPAPSLPSGVTYSYAPNTGIVTLNGTPITLAAGASFGPITISYRQPGSATSTVSAAVATTTTDPNLLNNAASAKVLGATQADLGVSLTFPLNVNAGQPVAGGVLYVNNGPSTALATTFNLTLPANLSIPPIVGGLPAGATYAYVPSTGVVTLSGMPASIAAAATLGPITVSYAQPPSGSSAVTAAIASTTSDPNPTNNSATATIAGVPVADTAVSLAFPAHVNAGLPVAGTVLFTNNGPSPAVATTFNLTLPINLAIAPTLGGLPTGVSYTYTAATGVVTLAGAPTTLAAGANLGPISVTYSQPNSGTSAVSASISAPTKDPNPANNIATSTITGAAAELLGTVYIDTNQDGLFDAGDAPVTGATVQLLSGAHVVATTTTNAIGSYSFAGEPTGTYSVAVAPAPGYLAASPASVSVSLNGGPATVVNFGQIPAGAVGSLVMTKTTPLVNISAGESVPYTITATNAKNTPLDTVTIADLIPAGFRFRSGSGSVNGKKQDPAANGRQLVWTHLTFASGEKKTFTLVLTAGAGVVGGEFVNEAMGYNGLTNTLISNVASATVRITADPTFDCPDLIGKVFDDKNANGREDPGEPGIAGVRLVTAQGLLVTTDSEGRYHIACPILPDSEIGTNFIVKLDERTLPSGYRLTTDNPETVRLTAGKVSKLNFGAAIHRVARIELEDSAFEAEQLRAEVRARLAALIASLKDEAIIVRLVYEASTEPDALIAKRMKAAEATLESLWTSNAGRDPLQVEDDIVRAVGPKP